MRFELDINMGAIDVALAKASERLSYETEQCVYDPLIIRPLAKRVEEVHLKPVEPFALNRLGFGERVKIKVSDGFATINYLPEYSHFFYEGDVLYGETSRRFFGRWDYLNYSDSWKVDRYLARRTAPIKYLSAWVRSGETKPFHERYGRRNNIKSKNRGYVKHWAEAVLGSSYSSANPDVVADLVSNTDVPAVGGHGLRDSLIKVGIKRFGWGRGRRHLD